MMNGGGSTGNPSAALSRLLPVYTDEETLQPADWVSASEEEGEQRGESVSLSQSQNQQNPGEIHQSPAKKHQSPPEEHHQSPAVKYQSPPAKKHQSPTAKEYQSTPAEEHQSPPAEEHQSTAAEEYQSPPAEEHQSTAAEEHQSPPAEEHQSTAAEEYNSPPAEEHQSTPAEEHQSTPAEEHQSTAAEEYQSLPAEEHQSTAAEEYQSLPAEEHQSTAAEEYQSPPAEEHQSTAAEEYQSPPAEEHQSTAAEEYQSPPAEEHQSPPAEEHQSPAETQQTTEESDQRVLNKHTYHKDPPTEKQKTENYFQTDHLKAEDQTAPNHETNADQPKPENCKPDRTELDHPPEDQEQLGDSPATNKKETKDSPATDQPKPEPLHTDLKKPGHPICDRLEQERANSQEHRQQEDLCLTNQNAEDDPPHPHPPLTDVTVFTSTFKEQHQKDFHLQESKHQQNQQDPPPEKFTVPTAERCQEQRDPAHLNTTPPPLAVHLTEASTLAPPLTIEVFCEQVGPHPLDSSSSEPKLCGFLQKQGGPLKAWKLRWFTHEEKKNQLFYYRTPQDVTPLGRVELCSATFTYPLKAEKGTFHIKTSERTFVLKAVTQEVMLYWLQQLQVKRWQHRQTTSCSETNNNSNNTADSFLPVLKSPLGLVGEAAANVPLQRTPLTNMSIKHPLIEIQNSVHSLRKRSSQEWSQSVFHVEAPPWTPPSAVDTSSPVLTAPIEPLTPPPALSLADQAGQVTLWEGRHLPSLFDSRSRKTKSRSSSNMQVLRRDTVSSERTSRLQQEKHMLMEEVKAQKELVWILHKALEGSQLEKRTCAEFLAATGEQERLELLRHRERLMADLRGQLEEAKAEVDALRRSLTQRETQLAELRENIRMLTEKNKARREVIIKLSEQVTACMSDPGPSISSCGGGLDSQAFRQLQQDVENLKDDIEAYETQNKFLNSEIYQLTKLWRKSSEQEKSLMVKCAFLEASNCQVESRYLGVLRQLQETKSLDPAQQGAVQKMIEDALKGELKSVVKLNLTRDYDEYGFKTIPEYEVEDMKLLAKIQALEIRSHNLLHQEGVDRPLLSRWAQYLAGRSDDDLCPSPELKALLRSGVPQEYRQRVWSWMVRTRTRTIREQHPQRYQQLCEKSRTCPHPASRQIQLDLHRTLTTNQHFCSPSSPALQQLRRILLAFSWQNPAIGYCQGLNRLAAIALLVLQSEENAFWCLVAMVEVIMPQDYYTKNLVASQADQRVLKDFLTEKLPRLAAHFEDFSIDVSLITFNWFLVVFVESLPSDILLPLWDAFLYEGTKVIFRYALALFKYKEDDILKIHDSVELYQYLRFFTKTISDSRKLISIAFSDMNPFPGRLLRNRRALHLDRLQGELQELEEQQREFVTESSKHKDKELDILVSEDDEEL